MIPMMLFPSSTREELLELRRDLHRHPELSFQEERTAAKLYESLERLKPNRWTVSPVRVLLPAWKDVTLKHL